MNNRDYLVASVNAFVCSVKYYSKVGSRNCLVSGDKHDCLLFGTWFRNPKKGQKLGEKVSGKMSFQVRAGLVKRTETIKAGMRKLKNTTTK